MTLNSNPMIIPKPVIALQILDPKINQIMKRRSAHANGQNDHEDAWSSSDYTNTEP